MRSSQRKPLLIACTFFILVAGAASQHWKAYRNERWHFCVQYPSGWSLNEAVDGGGVILTPPGEKDPSHPAQISIGAIVNARVRKNLPFPSLQEAFANELAGLKKEGAQDVTVLRQQDQTWNSLPSLATKVRYRDPDSGAIWVAESLQVRTPEELFYSFELKSPLSELSPMEAVLHTIENHSFKMNCAKEAGQ